MKIIELEIKNIRGIKDMILRPNKDNIVVWGTNGSGKSAVVDAIDFALTGRISRLTGQGTKNITLKNHGPHVDCTDLSKAFVRMIIELKDVNEPVELHRYLDKPKDIILSPEVSDRFLPIQKIALRGQNVLTRREILRFITAEGGKRAEEIQSLMNLGEIENIRKSIGRVVGTYDAVLSNSERNLRRARTDVSTRIGSKEFNEEEVLEVVNKNRKTLGGEPLTKLESGNLKSSLTPPALFLRKQDINIASFEQDLRNIISFAVKGNQKAIQEKDRDLRDLVSAIHEDSNLLHAISTQKLVNMGLELLDKSNNCPLCDTEWKPGELRIYLRRKSDLAKNFQSRIEKIDEAANYLLERVDFLISSLEKVIQTTKKLDLKDTLKNLETWKSNLSQMKSLLEDPLKNYHHIEFNEDDVKQIFSPLNIRKITSQLLTSAKAKFPESTPEQNAWDTLTELAVELKKLENNQREYDLAELAEKRASILQYEFEKARDEVLENLYDEIKDRFVELYRELHQDDESSFNATLRPDGAALDFEVDFYGRGSHPPHALHSEGHQDSMGVCLFLALSERLTSDLIDLIILDDVVMSVDTNHRRNLCNMLAKDFPGRQFLITTHERAWAMQLRYNGVVRKEGLYEFYNWSIDTGPNISGIVDLWVRIDQDIERNDVSAAASKLRRGAEQFFAEVCHNLNADVPYRIDNRHDLGELLSAAIGQFTKLLKNAKKAEASWDNNKPEEFQILDSDRKAIFQELGEEQWSVNVNVHFNEWANFEKNDFLPVVEAFKNLFDLFTCNKCNSLLRVVKVGNVYQNVRCNCGKVNWNLIKKKGKNRNQ